MSVARAAIRRPPPGALTGHLELARLLSAHPPLSTAVQLALRRPRDVAFALALGARRVEAQGQRPCQRRFQSTTARPRPGKQDPKQQQPPPPRQTLTRVLFRALWQSFRMLGAPFRSENIGKLYRQNPEELVLALAVLVALAVVIGYIVRVYFTYFYSEQFTRYPEPIAKALRRALYYSNYKLDPKMALKYYKQALELCDELRLDPFSDDIMGIKIQLAAWLEKMENYENSAKVLENLLTDCKRWVEVMEKSVKDGTVPKSLLASSYQALEAPAGEPIDVPETLSRKRSRILGKAVGISVKLAELYSDEHMLKQDLAHQRLIWAVETVLGELQRRTVEGVKEGEGEWMSAEQIGGTLESLGHSYEAKSQVDLALPLFFQALRLCKDQCHSAVLMNNIAACFAQHPILPVGEAPVDALMEPLESSGTPAARRASYLAAARRWATNAETHANEPQGEQRSRECDEACAVSLCNLADIANLTGNAAEARQRFEQAIALSKSIGFAPGVAQAEAGLRAMSKSVS